MQAMGQQNRFLSHNMSALRARSYVRNFLQYVDIMANVDYFNSCALISLQF